MHLRRRERSTCVNGSARNAAHAPADPVEVRQLRPVYAPADLTSDGLSDATGDEVTTCADCGASTPGADVWFVEPNYPGDDSGIPTLGEIALCTTCLDARKAARWGS